MKQIDTKRWLQISLICEGDYMVHDYMFKSFTHVFENVSNHFTILVLHKKKFVKSVSRKIPPTK